MRKICLAIISCSVFILVFMVLALPIGANEYSPTNIVGDINNNYPNCVYNQSTGNYTVSGFEYNESTDPYAKIFKIYFIISDQVWSVDSGSSYKQFNKTEYLNETELQNIANICNNTLKTGQDLLNQTAIEYNQHDSNGSLRTFTSFLKIETVTPMILQTRLNSIYALGNLHVPGYDRYTEQDAEYYANNFEYDSYHAYAIIDKLISDRQAAKEEAAYQNWIKTTGIRIEPGNYEESTKIVAPLGNFAVSFETRTPNKLSIENTTLSAKVGSGKEYHTETFKIDALKMSDGLSEFKLSIAQYIGTGSTQYKPTMPFSGYDSVDKKGYETLYPSSIQMDGHSARLYESYNIKHDTYPDRYAVTYAIDANTFVMIETYKLDYDKDVSLLFETLHIEKT